MQILFSNSATADGFLVCVFECSCVWILRRWLCSWLCVRPEQRPAAATCHNPVNLSMSAWPLFGHHLWPSVARSVVVCKSCSRSSVSPVEQASVFIKSKASWTRFRFNKFERDSCVESPSVLYLQYIYRRYHIIIAFENHASRMVRGWRWAREAPRRVKWLANIRIAVDSFERSR